MRQRYFFIATQVRGNSGAGTSTFVAQTFVDRATGRRRRSARLAFVVVVLLAALFFVALKQLG
jgi:hypothetical protein